MKNSFILYHDTLSVIEELTDEQAGQIIKEIYRISMHLNNPEKAKKPSGLSGLLNSVLHPFKMQLLRDFEAYKAVALRNAENGKKGGRPTIRKNPTKPKKADKDNEKDNEKDKDSVNDSNIKELLSCNKCKDIISYLNAKADTNYRATSRKTASLINARLKEGFTLEDFKSEIDDKVLEWGGDHKMSKYLRPETLFGTKFEGYLNTISKDVEPTSTIYFDPDNYKPYGVFEETS